MADEDEKTTLHRYLRSARQDLLAKLDGLSEYDVRRPLTPTGTNLLGLVKHLAFTESGYLGETFGRPLGEPLAEDEDNPNADLYATAEESREQITGHYREVWAHSDATIDALALDAEGRVPWWPGEHGRVTLHQILVHTIAETNRHGGHADIVRELIDGAVGLHATGQNLPERDQAWWENYRAQLEQIAQQAARSSADRQ